MPVQLLLRAESAVGGGALPLGLQTRSLGRLHRSMTRIHALRNVPFVTHENTGAGRSSSRRTVVMYWDRPSNTR
jgi:hypothetical protein